MNTPVFYTNNNTCTINVLLNSSNFLRVNVPKENPSYMVRYYDTSKCATFQGKSVIIAPITTQKLHQKRQKISHKNK